MQKGYILTNASPLIRKSGLRSLKTSRTEKQRPGPFLKWAGGKSQLLSSYERFFPGEFRRYFEPFTGGAAVFFHLRHTRNEFQAELSDLNQDLINCYEIVRDRPDDLIEKLKEHENSQEYFYKIRAQNPDKLSDLEKAARFIFLNKTCFNGLYRVNSKGQFNVPFGFYKNPRTCNEEVIHACSLALQETKLSCRPFEEVVRRAGKGDFVYFDPPYHPLNSTSNFTSYTKNSFSADDQIRLAETVKRLSNKGCYVMLSNSDSAFIRELYSQFRVETVEAMRAINCKAERRGKITETLILNY